MRDELRTWTATVQQFSLLERLLLLWFILGFQQILWPTLWTGLFPWVSELRLVAWTTLLIRLIDWTLGRLLVILWALLALLWIKNLCFPPAEIEHKDAPELISKRLSTKLSTPSTSKLRLHPTNLSLLDLPGEIRNHIYQLVVTQDPPPTPQWLDILNKKPQSQEDRVTWFRERCHLFDHSLVQPSITRVSKQIRWESLPIFYAEHVFFFERYPEQILYPWFEYTSDSDISHISAVCVALPIQKAPEDNLLLSDIGTVNLYITVSRDRTTLTLRSSSLLAPWTQNALARTAIDVFGGRKELNGLDLVAFVFALLLSREDMHHHSGSRRVTRHPREGKEYPVECHPDAKPPQFSAGLFRLEHPLTVEGFTSVLREGVWIMDPEFEAGVIDLSEEERD